MGFKWYIFSGTLPLERPDVRASTDEFGKDIACMV